MQSLLEKFSSAFAVFLVIVAFVGGYYAREFGGGQVGSLLFFDTAQVSQPVDVEFGPLWKAWNVLDDRFAPATTTQEVTDEQKLWGAIDGLAKSYNDPYTRFFPPVEAKNFEETLSGSFGGVGIEIGLRENQLTVIAPLEGTPGERAGLKAGDKIKRIDNESTDGISIEDAVVKIRGEIGTDVVLTVSRGDSDELTDIAVTRAVINIPTISTEYRTEEDIFVIELYNFNATAIDLFRGALREFVLTGSDKLIIDLRNNPGGFLGAAQDISSWFLPTGKVVVREQEKDGEQSALRSLGYNIFDDNVEVIVLVNGGSASASEIVAGALQDHGVATLVGETTFGKGSVQEIVDITDETSLKLTIAQWLTPNGRSISAGGLAPDIEVELTEEDFEAGRDPQLEKAIEILLQ